MTRLIGWVHRDGGRGQVVGKQFLGAEATEGVTDINRFGYGCPDELSVVVDVMPRQLMKERLSCRGFWVAPTVSA